MKGLLAVCLLLSIQPAPGKKEVEYVPLSTVQFFDFRKDSFTEGFFRVPQLQCVNESVASRCDHEVDWVRCCNENYNGSSYFENPSFRCSTSLQNEHEVILLDANVTYERHYRMSGDRSDLIVKNSHCLRYSFTGIDIDALLNDQKLLDLKVIAGCCFGSLSVVFSAFFLFAFLDGSRAKRTTSTETLNDLEDTCGSNHRRSSAFLQNVSSNIVRLKTQTSSLRRADESAATVTHR